MSRSPVPLVSSGAYSKKQLGGAGMMAWSHRRRFAKAVELALPHAGQPLLDYGCGDGTLLAYLADRFPQAVGAEIDPRLVQDCIERFHGLANVGFLTVDDLGHVADRSFGLIMCTEVMEHCTTETLGAAISTIARLLSARGTLIVSVPVETGLPLAVKQVARALKAARGGEATYRDREHYSVREFGRMLFAGERTCIERPAYRQDFAPDRPNVFHGHKGFNWRALRREVARTFVVESTSFSPVAALGPFCASQAWLTCRSR